MFIFDFEVFMYDWMVVFKDVKTNEYTKISNNTDALKKFYETNKGSIFVGYNNKAFDNIILQGILSGADPYGVMLLLFEEVPVHQVYKTFNITKYPLNTLDLIQDTIGMSLKEAEGYMGLSIEESSVPFDITRALTEKELNDVMKYCVHDVDATQSLLYTRQDYIKSKMNICKIFNLPKAWLDKTNAGLASSVLDAKNYNSTDELVYTLPENICILNPNYRQCIDLYTNGPLQYDKTLKMNIAGVPHTLAYGGLHGALDNFFHTGEMWQIDAASYYPTLMIEYGYISRAIKDISKYVQLYHDRIEAKKTDKPKADALKLVLNTTYGAMKSKYNALYDPRMANGICITGQLLLIDLIDKIESYCKLIQSNTDGILIIPHNKERIKEIINEWQKRTRIILEIEPCVGIWQKDVNNYIMRFENGKIKKKGGYVSQYDGGLRRSTRILDLAIVNYFVYGISVENTIMRHQDVLDFQIITKTGPTYKETFWKHKDGDVKVNKVNRVYATKHSGYGNVYKLKVIDGKERRDSVANVPDNCYVDNSAEMRIEYVDRRWYIDLAKKRITDFMGDKK